MLGSWQREVVANGYYPDCDFAVQGVHFYKNRGIPVLEEEEEQEEEEVGGVHSIRATPLPGEEKKLRLSAHKKQKAKRRGW